MFMVTLVYTVRCTLFYNYSYAIVKRFGLFLKRDKLCSKVPAWAFRFQNALGYEPTLSKLAAVPVS
jgi:hypothetical protein